LLYHISRIEMKYRSFSCFLVNIRELYQTHLSKRTVRCNSRPLGLQEEANGRKVRAHLPDQPVAAMVVGHNTVSTACCFEPGRPPCQGRTRHRRGYPARIGRDCGGLNAANWLGSFDEPLARRSKRDRRTKQLARLSSSGVVRNRVRPAVVDSRVSVL